ncbi:protein NEGATIVE GRAVITROPIC RESPONSE OF ROOTS-like isoform X1 [Phoenix dactylifera]|uniref:Protein NEGATIVE GRAVITROPIC RESPONSE OF ROOTS-like isoform X1 n=1 Tax=Phoenix dactylifera TaxID=42345 RepID=A0A8B9AN09_PHODC|nr:protein NEGATIVE GRAVITROPIC RESPONSE OF ROOTS-like isoform X1 [Phoenix dactylifera]
MRVSLFGFHCLQILNWVQNKFVGRQKKNKVDVGSSSARHTTMPDTHKDEFSDWPQALLAIGTFGNSELEEDTATYDSSKSLYTLQDQPDLLLEEVIKFQKELAKLLAAEPKSRTDESEMEWGKEFCDGFDDEDNCDLSPNSKIILNRAKNLLADPRGAIKKKSISFLLKKMFVCKSGFGPARNLRDPFPESKIEKLLKTMLHKKIHPQNSNSTSKPKHLEKKQEERTHAEDKMHEEEKDGGKWVKTDSEYIVLEM